MPSKRQLLAASGTLFAAGFAGCSLYDRGTDGYVQLKSVQARETDGTRQTERSLIRVTLSSPPGAGRPELTYLDDEWGERFDTPRTPVVTDALHAELTRAFETIRYIVGVCTPAWADDGESTGCYNVSTTRENFNRVQVHDQVTASSDGTSLVIHSVDGTWGFENQ